MNDVLNDIIGSFTTLNYQIDRSFESRKEFGY